MSDIKDWSISAASNNFSPPDGFPENQAPSTVNNGARELMAAVKRDKRGVDVLDHTDLPLTLTASDAGKVLVVDMSGASADEDITLPAEATAGEGWKLTGILRQGGGSFDLLIKDDAGVTQFTLSLDGDLSIPVTDGIEWFDLQAPSLLITGAVDFNENKLQGHAANIIQHSNPGGNFRFESFDTGGIHRSSGVTNDAWIIQDQATEPYPGGWHGIVHRSGVGTVTIRASAGVLLNNTDGGQTTILSRFGTAFVYRESADTWNVSGDVDDVA